MYDFLSKFLCKIYLFSVYEHVCLCTVYMQCWRKPGEADKHLGSGIPAMSDRWGGGVTRAALAFNQEDISPVPPRVGFLFVI